MTDPAAMRRDYLHGRLDESSARPGWLEQFRLWFADASADPAITEANAMQVATVGVDGLPSVRTVLLKGFDERGVVFYTSFDSPKGRDLDAHPQAAAVFAWLAHERQVRISGPVSRVDQAQTDAYFASRPRGSQISAWASPQSHIIAARTVLTDAVAELDARFAGQQVPTPPRWGGFRIAPQRVEFWQGRADRLHDRLLYRRGGGEGGEGDQGGGWTIERLAP